jgi:hypothetical protein
VEDGVRSAEIDRQPGVNACTLKGRLLIRLRFGQPITDTRPGVAAAVCVIERPPGSPD